MSFEKILIVIAATCISAVQSNQVYVVKILPVISSAVRTQCPSPPPQFEINS